MVLIASKNRLISKEQALRDIRLALVDNGAFNF
jgi:hypothetical protein